MSEIKDLDYDIRLDRIDITLEMEKNMLSVSDALERIQVLLVNIDKRLKALE